MEKNPNVSVYLREKRIQKNLTQSEVAEKLGYSSPQFVSNWERGLCNPPLEAIATLIDMYDLPKREVVELLLEQTRREIEVALDGKKSRRKNN